ncbi:unnamed protein product [Natator depressus]
MEKITALVTKWQSIHLGFSAPRFDTDQIATQSHCVGFGSPLSLTGMEESVSWCNLLLPQCGSSAMAGVLKRQENNNPADSVLPFPRNTALIFSLDNNHSVRTG